jgi:uncharacterized membrane protein YhaH (DUF805 family)
MDTAKLQSLLITFEGRIGPNSLMQGTVAVFAIAIVINLLAIVIPFISILGIALLYPLFCLYAKRFHDGGKPAIWTLAVLAGVFVGGIILGMLLTPLIVGDVMAMAMRGETPSGMGFRLRSFALGVINAGVIYFGAAFVVNQLVKSDPAPNAYGEPAQDASSINPLN